MGVSFDVWRRRIAGCYGSRGLTIGKKRREALPDTLPEERKKTGKKRRDAEQVCIYKICPGLRVEGRGLRVEGGWLRVEG